MYKQRGYSGLRLAARGSVAMCLNDNDHLGTKTDRASDFPKCCICTSGSLAPDARQYSAWSKGTETER
jgi:hypothetical protein